MYGRRVTGLVTVLALVAAAANSGCTTHRKHQHAAAAPAAPHAQIGAWGVDLTSIDTTVKPGDDFYRYADGKWLDSTQIPPDRTSWSSFVELADRAENQLHGIVEGLPQDVIGAPPGSPQQKAGDFYRAYLDTYAIEKQGIDPALPALQAIMAARTHERLAQL